ncbi:MAG: AIR synthase-related protein [Microthrixaceae bacterium]
MHSPTILKFAVHRSAGDDADPHLRREVADLRSWRVYYLEVGSTPTDEALSSLEAVLADPLTETVRSGDAALLGPGEVQVGYRRGIVDNEHDTIVGVARMVGLDAIAAKVSTVYASGDPRLAGFVASEACNPNIEELHETEPHYDTLSPVGEYTPMETFDLVSMTPAQLAALGRANGRSLDASQMEVIRGIQVRTGADHVSDVLIEALDARWSDHCDHTTWKALGGLLQRLIDAARATGNPNIVSMFHDNAGVWDFTDGHAIALKAETHNGPSAVSAYFGQLTKIGGVLRDILGTGLGADPIGVFEYTATGIPGTESVVRGRPDPARIAVETVRAVKEYGNTFGVPMMWSRMTFHPAYRAKPFALGGSVGLIPVADAARGVPEPHDLVVLIGGLTGNDGIHGASASSAGAAAMDATSVQIGAPLEGIKFRGAIGDLRDRGCLRAVTDLGAAGLNSAVGEMGDPCGVWIDTALVPLKTHGLAMWRILLSESQERMLLAVPPDRLDETRAVLALHDVRGAVIGSFTGKGSYRVTHGRVGEEEFVAAARRGVVPTGTDAPGTSGGVGGELGFDVAYDLLEWKPEPRSAGPTPEVAPPRHEWPPVDATTPASVAADTEVADQSFAALQYDSSVQGLTHYGPLEGRGHGVATGYYASRPLRASRAGIVFSTGFHPYLFDVDPVAAARQSVLSALVTQSLAGVARGDVCLCDNFYTPDRAPFSDEWLVAMVEELAGLSEWFGTPFISGKDSSAGSTDTAEGVVSVPPAVFVSALGKVADVSALRPEQWTRSGNHLVLIGPRTPALAGTAVAGDGCGGE